MIKLEHGQKLIRIGSPVKNLDSGNFNNNKNSYINLIKSLQLELDKIKECGGQLAVEKQHSKGKMTVRERINYLIDDGSKFLELGLFAAFDMYKDVGSIPAAGVIIGIGKINGSLTVIVGNDATVKAGAYFEISLKKTLRAQQISLENNIPIIYLVDSAGVFLPLQDQVFPDENHFGKIFYNNARMSALGINQIAVVMGPCVAGGAYLPVMCDKYVIVEGSNMFLAGPALVKAAIGQDIDKETLGGAKTHSSISGTSDYHAKDDISALNITRDIINHTNLPSARLFDRVKSDPPHFEINDIIGYINSEKPEEYDILEIISRIVDRSEFLEFKSNYGKTIVCGNAKIGGYNVGIIANQRKIQKTELGELQMGGVIYSDSADKAARFVMNCNQDSIPIIFMHDVNGFMIGKDAEWGGIAKNGAKLVNTVSNSVVPKITLIIGGSYGAGNYAMSGRSYNPRFVYAWPTAKIAVMGGAQAAKTLLQIKLSKMGKIEDSKKHQLYDKIKKQFEKQQDIKYGAARMWVDEIIMPHQTRDILIKSLNIVNHQTKIPEPKFGVLQV
ncbi:MAG: acyl-CoA carboxylase subunit beta [Candidatus Neomarinimicrobiota bacterium]|jgi:acetyl-CoA carboxylase carboxyltransferase component|nr:acyl-CoA carboxylase subunit beta [Candidatus Neomarinimicrobiota bacterium]